MWQLRLAVLSALISSSLYASGPEVTLTSDVRSVDQKIAFAITLHSSDSVDRLIKKVSVTMPSDLLVASRRSLLRGDAVSYTSVAQHDNGDEQLKAGQTIVITSGPSLPAVRFLDVVRSSDTLFFKTRDVVFDCSVEYVDLPDQIVQTVHATCT